MLSTDAQLNRAERVSVIIPTYERGHIVGEAIDSVLSQTLQPHEVIVVDDGSTDNTAQELKKYGNRISYHHQENQGVSAARNRGLTLASGEYVAFLDSDDVWDPRKLEIQVAILKKVPDVFLLFTDFGIFKSDGSKEHHGTRRWFPEGIDYPDLYDQSYHCQDLGIKTEINHSECMFYCGHVFDRMLNLPYGLLSSAILRRTLIEGGLRFTQGVSLYEDWEFFALAARSHMVGFLDRELTFNRSHRGPERLTLRPSIVKTRSYLGVLERVWKSDADFLARNGSALKRLESNALLVLARDSALEGDKSTVSEALARWKSLEGGDGRARAWLFGMCSSVPYGPILLRFLLRVRTLFRIVTGSASKGRYSCAPG